MPEYSPRLARLASLPVREIPLTRGYSALVDDADFDWLSQWKWHAGGRRGLIYGVRFEGPKPRQRCILMHRELLGLTVSDDLCDHQDGNGLNNQRHNLRRATRSQNAMNMKKGRGQKFKGVSRNGTKFCARLQARKTKIFLGNFSTEIEAARAYDIGAREHYGEFARLNFPSEREGVPA